MLMHPLARFILFFGLIAILLACGRKVISEVLLADDTLIRAYAETTSESLKPADLKLRRIKDSGLNYVPDPEKVHGIIRKTIRVNFHFMQDSSLQYNFHGSETKKAAHELIDLANQYLRKNEKMRLPVGNDTRMLDSYFQYQITPGSDQDDGIYEHVDERMWYFVKKGKQRNNSDRSVIKKYGIGTDSILNIFVMPHHPDSLKSSSYSNTQNGIALGTNMKIAGWYENGKTAEQIAPMFNHETGHIFGLSHSWLRQDRCDDTPSHDNCWASTGEPPCDGLTSNNMMDYNNSQKAITPCQIGRMHMAAHKIKSPKRDLLVADWCSPDTAFSIEIRQVTTWDGARDINQNILVHSGACLTLRSRVSMARGCSITIAPDGELILDRAMLHNACGEQWPGIRLLRSKRSVGKISMIGDVIIDDLETGSVPTD